MGLPAPQLELTAKGPLLAAASTLPSPALPEGLAVIPGAAGLCSRGPHGSVGATQAWGVLGLPCCSPLVHYLPGALYAVSPSTLCSPTIR